jgi:hypothetical protein
MDTYKKEEFLSLSKLNVHFEHLSFIQLKPPTLFPMIVSKFQRMT